MYILHSTNMENMEHFQKKCVHYLEIKFYSTCTCITNLNHHMSDDLTKYLW